MTVADKLVDTDPLSSRLVTVRSSATSIPVVGKYNTSGGTFVRLSAYVLPTTTMWTTQLQQAGSNAPGIHTFGEAQASDSTATLTVPISGKLSINSEYRIVLVFDIKR
jgi:hypothetical protein